MTSTRRKRQGFELGYDAFLDIVANLVGILIILVVVLGAQSTGSIDERESEVDTVKVTTGATSHQVNELAIQTDLAAAAQADSNRFERLIGEQKLIIDRKREERNFLLDMLSQAENAWQESQQQLDNQKVSAARRLVAFEEKQAGIEQLKLEAERLKNQNDSVTKVQHLPTPMAKTVFGDEVHFRLKDNRFSVVPLDPLLTEIKKDFERFSVGSKEGRQESAVGPIRGFIARYELDKEKGTISRGGQIKNATRIQLVNLSIEPLVEPHGIPLQEFIQGKKQLDIELAGRDPSTTTITVWVYPDSFESFRVLKEILYQRGFATAARPLPMGHVISGSPDGSRSRAQ
ncbi:MAG: hypothetical protein ACPHL6_07235 [Rubripirellula sp.]